MQPPNKVADFLRAAAERRLKRASVEQRKRREEVDARNERLQWVGVRRGPSAPRDGTFGGKADG